MCSCAMSTGFLPGPVKKEKKNGFNPSEIHFYKAIYRGKTTPIIA